MTPSAALRRSVLASVVVLASGLALRPISAGACAGDCNGDGRVPVDEVLTLVNIAVGNTLIAACEAGDANHDGQITVDEILAAVNAALTGCPPLTSIVSISVCTFGSGPSGSCPNGSFDTHQLVRAPNGGSINQYGAGYTSDEHSSVFPPGNLGNNSDYLFFVATGTQNVTTGVAPSPNVGAVVLSGGSGPDQNGQWTFDFPKADGYGLYASGFGHVFVEPTAEARCPTVPDGNPADQDQTFDLSYAAPGSVVQDPTGPPGGLLMIYESVNHCIGNAGGSNRSGDKAYISSGVATSLDYGMTWPTYRGTPTFNFVPLPENNSTQGPSAPMGAFGKSVCMGNDCTTTPPDNYGRYEILSPSVSLASLMAAGQPLSSDLGEGEIAAFVDDISASPAQYLYVLTGTLKIARAQFNGNAPLTFQKWDGQAFASPGMGGADSPIFSSGPFQNCEAPVQNAFGASISYVEDTHQYLLTFVCDSPGDPANGGGTGASRGGAWFYSTSYDVSDPRQWSAPKEIVGSWGEFDTSGGCPNYKGWYPTFMSLSTEPGHLSTSGYVFYLWGCQQGGPGRQFSSRRFTIRTQ